VLAWAILWRWQGGLLAAVAVSVADISIRDGLSQKVYGNLFLLIVGGAIVGFLSALLQRTAAERDRAERAAAAADERQRLARVVHDGVLQVLALVQRRAPELGPDGRELGRLAGEQEVQLRGLVQQGSRDVVAPLGDRDLVRLLAELQSAQVHVAVPGTPAMLPAERASEVLAAVESCLSNVRHHVGRDAEAWVLLEEFDDHWVVSVRDDGPGIPEGRLEESAAEGRLGVQQSIVGRLRDLGGGATVRSVAGQGTEWELSVPR
jgi:signal transduction histidine kinase